MKAKLQAEQTEKSRNRENQIARGWLNRPYAGQSTKTKSKTK
jgi:hypothetical protein